MSAASIYDFNDPFELHHRPGRLASRAEEQARIKKVAQRNKAEFEAGVLLKGANLKRSKRKVNKAIRKKSGNPFVSTTPNLIEAQRKRAPRIFDQFTKVICCSKATDPNPGEIPMWGYYAECHRGIRIHYSPDFYSRAGILAKPMEYEEQPVEFGFPESTDEGMRAYVDKVLLTKAISWKHEAEVRLFIPIGLLRREDDGTGTKTLRWWIATEPAHVTRVDLGIKFDNSTLVERLKAGMPKVEIFQTTKNPKAYLCQYDQIH